jgi:hypothetical protein
MFNDCLGFVEENLAAADNARATLNSQPGTQSR